MPFDINPFRFIQNNSKLSHIFHLLLYRGMFYTEQRYQYNLFIVRNFLYTFPALGRKKEICNWHRGAEVASEIPLLCLVFSQVPKKKKKKEERHGGRMIGRCCCHFRAMRVFIRVNYVRVCIWLQIKNHWKESLDIMCQDLYFPVGCHEPTATGSESHSTDQTG